MPGGGSESSGRRHRRWRLLEAICLRCMLTPRFELSQDVDFVHVHISMPHLRAEDGEFYVEGNEFKFHLRPYFLRLTFRQRLVEDGREGASYDAGSGVLSIRLPKEVPGEPFTGLSMLSELLRKPSVGPGSARPMIEVLSSSQASDDGAGEEGEDEDDDPWAGAPADPNELLAMDAEADQSVAPALGAQVRYGFNDAFCGLFTGLECEGLLQLPDPESANRAGRRLARERSEAESFDPDHYIADWMDTVGGAAQAFVPWWDQPEAQGMREGENEAWLAGGAGGAAAGGEVASGGGEVGSRAGSGALGVRCGGGIAWSAEERDQLLRLPRQELLLSLAESSVALCGLADVLYGYCYDVRTTDGDHNCESGWTVRALSSQLAWLDTPLSPADAARTSLRRALCYPLVRHWGLATAALRDVVALLRLGRPAVLKALLKVHTLMLGCEYGYLLNRCFIDPMCVWVQQSPGRRLARLADALEGAVPGKGGVGWPLERYEALAREDAEGGGGSEGERESEGEEGSESESEGGESGEGASGAHFGESRVVAPMPNGGGVRGPLIVELGDAEVGEEGRSRGMELEEGGTLV